MSTNNGQRFKIACYTIEGALSFAVSFYFYYLYFLMRHRFDYGDKRNLALAALLGFVYVIAAWQGGRFGQRHGHFSALKLGFGVMIAALFAGSLLDSAWGAISASMVLTVGMCFLWPNLEALVSEGEDAVGLPRAIGTYNVVWASTNALGLFLGGTLIEGLGFNCLFYIPLAISVGLLVLTLWLEKHVGDIVKHRHQVPVPALPPDPNRPPPAKAKLFLHMAWLANPFAYIAINTLAAVLPGLAAKFHLTPMFAGFACSLWGFARLATFFALWFWTGWHYRFRWLVAAFGTLIVTFALVLIVPSFTAVLLAQILFGGAIGLIYYSSLFYSMDNTDTRNEHGGIHEAAIGLGNCLGPAIGAAALWLAPGCANAGAWAVSGLLSLGLGGLLWLGKGHSQNVKLPRLSRRSP